jgi:aspartyl-tRNA(Asn)/glutamyl-tRNA(Gln) amidotransferase subunit C
MRITEQDVQYVADLANLELTEEERHQMQRDLDSILGYIDLLNELDTQSVEPMAQVQFQTNENSEAGTAPSAARSDTPGTSLSLDAALMNAPASDGNFFKVPKVVDR